MPAPFSEARRTHLKTIFLHRYRARICAKTTSGPKRSFLPAWRYGTYENVKTGKGKRRKNRIACQPKTHAMGMPFGNSWQCKKNGCVLGQPTTPYPVMHPATYKQRMSSCDGFGAAMPQ